jgi:hypothetical protein
VKLAKALHSPSTCRFDDFQPPHLQPVPASLYGFTVKVTLLLVDMIIERMYL